MALKREQAPALTHEQRVQRLQQLTADLAKAVDVAEEQRRILRDRARDASELADSLANDTPEPPPSPARRSKKR